MLSSPPGLYLPRNRRVVNGLSAEPIVPLSAIRLMPKPLPAIVVPTSLASSTTSLPCWRILPPVLRTPKAAVTLLID